MLIRVEHLVGVFWPPQPLELPTVGGKTVADMIKSVCAHMRDFRGGGKFGKLFTSNI